MKAILIISMQEATRLPNNAELATIGRRRRPQLMLQIRNPPPSCATTAGNANHICNRHDQPAIPIPSSCHISSSMQLNDPYRGFVALTEPNTLTTEHVISADATHCVDGEVHTAAVRGLGNTIAANSNVGPLAPMELIVHNS